MGLLIQKTSGTAYQLTRHQVLGRSSTASLQLNEGRISGRHAAIRWDGLAWQVKDLLSRNGTFVNGKMIAPGSMVEVSAGNEIAFGSLDNVYILRDAAAPAANPMLVPKSGNGALCLDGGLCVLPSQEAPELTIFRDDCGDWWCEYAGQPGAVRLAEGEQVTISGEHFRFTSNAGPADTSLTQAARDQLCLRDVCLEFSIPRNEDSVTLQLVQDAQPLPMGTKSAYYLLLTLARIRLGHPFARDHVPFDDGWVYADTLATMLGVSKEQINVDVCRVRQAFREQRIADPAAIIERQRHQLRIGTTSVVIRQI